MKQYIAIVIVGTLLAMLMAYYGAPSGGTPQPPNDPYHPRLTPEVVRTR